MLNAMTQGNDGSLSTIHANSSLEVFNRIATYALQAAERLPIEATHMLIAGAIDFVVFIEKRNDYARGGRLRRFVSSVREVNGVDGRVLSSEVFAPGPDGRRRAARADRLPRRAGRARLPADDAGRLVTDDLRPTSLLALLGRRARRRRRAACSSLAVGVRRRQPARPDGRPTRLAPARPRPPAAARAVAPALVVLVVDPLAGRRRSGPALLVFVWRGAVRRRRRGAGRDARGWRAWPPGPSRCATRSPARSAWSRPSRPRPRAAAPTLRPHAARAGRPAAHPDAAAGRAAAVRRRPRRPLAPTWSSPR